LVGAFTNDGTMEYLNRVGNEVLEEQRRDGRTRFRTWNGTKGSIPRRWCWRV